jgi:hypothetical protein
MIQEVLAAITVGAAALYLVFKLFVMPRIRAKGPDVPASRLVRKPRAKPSSSCH